jgi:hypothetical protein
MNYLEDFEEEPYTWKDYLFAIITAPIAIPLFLIKKLVDIFKS